MYFMIGLVRNIKKLYTRINIKKGLYYFDSFDNWDDAYKASLKFGEAYESENIIEKVIEATEAVRNGDAVYEQDGVLYYEDAHVYEFLAALFYVFSRKEKINICDFGGALGSTYFRYRKFFPKDRINWNIIEQKAFVDYGKRYIPEIKFHYSVQEQIHDSGKIDVVLFLSVLPYLDNPDGILTDVFEKKPEYILVDETVFNVSEEEEEHIVLQYVPAEHYKAVYPSHIFNRGKFIRKFESNGYEKVLEWIYPVGAIPTIKRFTVKENIDRGFLFRLVEE